MNSLEKLKEKLKGKTADEAVDLLFQKGALDHHLARRYVIVDEFEMRYSTSDASAREVQEDLAFEHGVSRSSIRKYLMGTNCAP